MTQLKWNVLANFAGRGWIALMSIAFIPLYIKFMGIEAYGLVGFFTSLLALLSLLDLGLSTTINREMARYSVEPNQAKTERDLLRTLEVVYWAVGIIIGAAILFLSPLIAHYWIKADKLAPATVQQAVTLMGLVIAFQWPSSLYEGGLMGLQQQVLWNSIGASMATLRGVGIILILRFVSPTIQAFFGWQMVISALQTTVTAFCLWHSLPGKGQKPRFSKDLLLTIWHFAAGMSAVSLVSLILTQMDKIILSKLLTLEMFGYYSFATAVASGLYRLTGPVFAALFPNFSKLAAPDNQEKLRQLYHRGCQLMSVVILPAAIVLTLFSPKILLAWTRNPVTVENTYRLVSVLIIGTMLNSLMYLPFALQLAHGWTALAFYKNVIAIIVFVPLAVFLAFRYGGIGAALVWMILNSSYVLIELPIMHHRLLRGEMWRWYLEDVGLPLLATLTIVGLGRWLIPASLPLLGMLMAIVAVFVVALFAATLAAPQMRARMLNYASVARMTCCGS
jgi:O-antigen/teichoic acid export membrane protein